MALAETIASVYVPHYAEADVVTRVRTLRVFELASSTPEEVTAQEALADPDADHLVLVSTNCFHNANVDASFYNDATAAYLVGRDGLRAAFDVRLGARCACETITQGDASDLGTLQASLAGFDVASGCTPWGGWDVERLRE